MAHLSDFRIRNVFTTLSAHVWGVHNEVAHVHDCFARLLHSAWFGNFVILQPSRALSAGIVRERKNRVCGYISAGVSLRAKSLCVEADNHIMTTRTKNP